MPQGHTPQISFIGFKCFRCGHAWVPRKKSLPRWCPKCKSPYWNKPRKKDAK